MRTFTLCLALISICAASHAEPVPAQPAARFVDSMGVNVHAHTTYAKNHEELTAKLAKLGIRHVRDGLYAKACEFAMDFFRTSGIKTIWITGRRVGGEKEYLSPLKRAAIDDELRDLRKLALPCTAALEGPNEYDLHSDQRDADWPATLRAYHETLFAKVKADPELQHLPVVGPSLTSEAAYRKVGDLDAVIDAGCVHHYQSTRHPGTPGWGPNGYGSIDWTWKYLAAAQSPTKKPLWSTECGYEPGGGDPISEQAEAKYLPRMFAEFFRRGYFRSYQYELLGNQWGLLRADLSERPAFTALQNLIAVLRDDSPAGPARSLDFTVKDAPKDLRQMLLSKGDGSFCLLLWREVPSWDVDKKSDLMPTPKKIAIDLPAGSRAELYVPGQAAEAVQKWDDAAHLNLEIGDTLTILRIVGSGG